MHPDIEHDMLTDPLHEIGLPNLGHELDKKNGNINQNERAQPFGNPGRDMLIDCRFDNKWTCQLEAVPISNINTPIET